MMTALGPNLLASQMRAMYQSIQRAPRPLGKNGEPGTTVACMTSEGKSSMKLTSFAAALAGLLASLAAPARADVTHVAVAANFTDPA